MPESVGKAVFLSYASQDAVAARRICEALQAAEDSVPYGQRKLASDEHEAVSFVDRGHSRRGNARMGGDGLK